MFTNNGTYDNSLLIILVYYTLDRVYYMCVLLIVSLQYNGYI